MPYTVRYRLTFSTLQTTVITVDICPKSSIQPGPDMPIIFSLNDQQGRHPAKPLVISCTNDEEDKQSPFRTKQATIQFFSQTGINLTTFQTGEDDEFFVEIYQNSDKAQNIFKGYLVLDDIDQDFQDDSIGNVITLIATDNLALLQDMPLKDFNGNNPVNEHKIIQFIAWALGGTNLQLPINIINSIMEEGSPGVPFYNSCYLHSKTFEAEIGESVSSYEVLQKILTPGCFIGQHAGEWWIVRLDELEDGPLTNHRFTAGGAYSGSQSYIFSRTIGFNDVMWFSNETAYVTIQRPRKEVKQSYVYEYPKEILDNIDFSRGDFWAAHTTADYTAYHLNDWAALNTSDSGSSSTSTIPGTGWVYIKRIFDAGYEKERYVSMSGTGPAFIQSNGVPVGVKDKVNVSVDFRFNTNFTGNADDNINHAFTVMLYADNGNVYTYGVPTPAYRPAWWQVTTDPRSRIVALYTSWKKADVDESQTWQTLSAEIPEIPHPGKLAVRLLNGQGGINYNNLQFTYTPFINGSYAVYKAQEHRITQAGNYKAVREDELGISDASRKVFKGAILKPSAGGYQLAGRFYNGAQHTGGLPAPDFLHPYSEITAFDTWNQVNRAFRVFDGEIQGLDYPDFLHIYWLSDSSPHTNNKRFILLHYEQDWELCSWTGVFSEVYDQNIMKDYTSTHTFKYLEER